MAVKPGGSPTEDWNEQVEVTIDHVLTTTDKAVKVHVADRELWLPLSLVDETRVPAVGQSGSLWVAKWRAVEDNLPFVDHTKHPLLRKQAHRYVGRRVQHKVFGDGTVRAVQGDKLVVTFAPPHGQKTMLPKFVGLELP